MAVSSPSTLLLFLLLVFPPSSALLSRSGVSPEVKTLLTIKNLLEDPQGVLNWDVSSVNPCAWTFVTCSPELFVIGLLLQTNNITGPIPAEIGKLAKVMKLNLSRNHLYGEIPSSVPHLGRLQYLDLSYNNLSGPVPRFFAGTLNIVGNPLMCGVNTGQDCSGTAPVPMSSNLEISQASLPTAKTKTHKFAVVLGYMIACVIILWFPIS